jgi:hypothetical protein
MKLVIAILAFALIPTCAFAVDGVVLINQSTVTSAGGFPYTISQPGSYKLSGNLSVPANIDGILITASNVTLDLNGFSIVNVPTGLSSSAVIKTVGGITSITIRNGTISATGGAHPVFAAGAIGEVMEDLTLKTDITAIAVFGFSTIVRRVSYPFGEIDLNCQSLVVDSLAEQFVRVTTPSASCSYAFGFVLGAIF